MDSQVTLIMVTATQFVLNWLEVFTDSLRRHNEPGEYHLVVLSFPGAFSQAGRKRLAELEVELYEQSLSCLQIQRFAAEHATSAEVYRLKHLGKSFLVESYLATREMAPFHAVLVTDLDIIFQAPLKAITRTIEAGKIIGAEEYPPLGEQPLLAHKLRRALQFPEYQSLQLDLERHEINFGFYGGFPATVLQFSKNIADLVQHPALSALLEAERGSGLAYHEQDFMRLYLQASKYRELKVVNNEVVLHLCHLPGSKKPAAPPVRMEVLGPGHIYPAVVHFAGGVWPMFLELRHWLDGYDLSAPRASLREHFGTIRYALSPERSCLKVAPGGESSPLQQAYQAYEDHDFSGAVRLFRELNERNPQEVDSLFGLALSLLQVGEIDRGSVLLNSYFAQVQGAVERRKMAARVLEERGELEWALQIWLDVAKRLPDNPLWLLPTVRLLCAVHGIAEGRTFLQKTISSTAAVLSAVELGECFETVADVDGAREVYEQALLASSPSLAVFLRLLRLLRSTGDSHLAAQRGHQFLEAGHDSYEVRLHVVAALYESGKFREFLLRVAQFFPGMAGLPPGMVKCCARAMLRTGQQEEARQVLSGLLENQPESFMNTPHDSGLLLRDAGLLPPAVKFFDLAATRDAHPDGALLAAGCLVQHGISQLDGGGYEDLREARRRLEMLLITSRQQRFLEALCDVCRELGDFASATMYARELATVAPEVGAAKGDRISEAQRKVEDKEGQV